MFGSLIGYIVGSHYEFLTEKGTTLPLYVHKRSSFTDDSVLTIATAAKLLGNYDSYTEAYRKTYKLFNSLESNGGGSVDMGYGKRFQRWAESKSDEGYGSKGNGSAMRVSPVAYIAKNKSELMLMAKESAEATHNSPEGIFAAQAVALGIFRSLEGRGNVDIMEEIRNESIDVLGDNNPYLISYNIHELHKNYRFSALANKSVPQAIFIGLNCSSFEEALRFTLYVGGDTDTIGAIAGSIAEARFGIPEDIKSLLFPLRSFAPEYYKVANSFYEEYVETKSPATPKTLSRTKYVKFWLIDKKFPFAEHLLKL